MIQLETPRKYRGLIDQAHQMALNVLRPLSRKYDLAEHTYPKELDILAAVIDTSSPPSSTA
jgi:acyl-CoA dehydrogenase